MKRPSGIYLVLKKLKLKQDRETMGQQMGNRFMQSRSMLEKLWYATTAVLQDVEGKSSRRDQGWDSKIG